MNIGTEARTKAGKVQQWRESRSGQEEKGMIFISKVEPPGNGENSSPAGARLSAANVFSPLAVARYLRAFGLAFVCMAGALMPVGAFSQHSHAAAPPPSPMPSSHASPPPRATAPAGRPNSRPSPPGQQHLNEWLQQNRGLSTQQQMQRLQSEPGFSRLPPQQQQRLMGHVQQLDRMTPEQRQRVVERVENMERLSPQQQQTVRFSASRLGQLPPYRQQVVKEAIKNLRDVPPAQRQSELYSPRYASRLTPEERGIVGNLLTVESYHPPSSYPR
jgi:hypothetical protein